MGSPEIRDGRGCPIRNVFVFSPERDHTRPCKTDCSAKCATAPARRRAKPRSVRSPRRHRRSRSAQSGTTEDASARSPADKTAPPQSAAASRRQNAETAQRGFHRFFKLRAFYKCGLCPCDEHQIIPRLDARGKLPVCRTDDPPTAGAPVCFSDLFSGGDAGAGVGKAVLARKKR